MSELLPENSDRLMRSLRCSVGLKIIHHTQGQVNAFELCENEKCGLSSSSPQVAERHHFSTDLYFLKIKHGKYCQIRFHTLNVIDNFYTVLNAN